VEAFEAGIKERSVVIEFDSPAKAMEVYKSPAYQSALKFSKVRLSGTCASWKAFRELERRTNLIIYCNPIAGRSSRSIAMPCPASHCSQLLRSERAIPKAMWMAPAASVSGVAPFLSCGKTWKYGAEAFYIRDPDGHLREVVTPGVWSIY
jgi:hypothetical protein